MLNKTSIFVCDIANAINMNSFAKRPIMKTRWVCITTGLYLFKCYSEESKLSRGSEQSIVKSNNVITKQFVQVIRVIHCKVTARGGKKARASLPPRSLSHSLPQVFVLSPPLIPRVQPLVIWQWLDAHVSGLFSIISWLGTDFRANLLVALRSSWERRENYIQS